MITLGASESVPLSAVNGFESFDYAYYEQGAGTADSIRKFLNLPIPVKSDG